MQSRPWLVLALLLASGAAESVRAQRPVRGRGLIEHEWRPVREGDELVTAIAVRTVLSELPPSAGDSLVLTVPISYAGVGGIADRIERLQVSDRFGSVPLGTEDDAPTPGGFPFFRRFKALRPVGFPVTIEYRATAPRELLRGPQFALYSGYGGISGAGSGFLLLPDLPGDVTSRVHWDLRDLPTGSTAVTTFGAGDFTIRGPADQLRHGWIMAGPLGRHPARGVATGLTGYWLGDPEWDPVREMTWVAGFYRYLGQAYRYLRPLPEYRVFVRVAPDAGRISRSGTALGRSFMAGAEARKPNAARTGTGPRETFAHELGHLFVGGIEAPVGVDSWFSEGLNSYYTRLLTMRGGFGTVADYVREVDQAFRDYYHGKARNWSADSIARIGFGDEAVRHMPYLRSSLYFADLDAKIRARSRGRRSLDDLTFDLFTRRERGESIDHEKWIAAVTAEAGPSAREDFESVVLRGDRTLIPAPDAFGRCVTRETIRAPGASPDSVDYRWIRVDSIPESRCRLTGPPR